MSPHEKAPRNGPKTWTVREGTGDPLLAILPLRDAGKALAAELIRDGFGEHCGHCEKPFDAVRKWRGIARVTHLVLGRGLCTTAWLLCGRCNADMRRSGGRVSDKLMGAARETTGAMITMSAPAGGRA